MAVDANGKWIDPNLAYTFSLPEPTDVQPETSSPILPQPFPFTFTLDDPDAIGA